MPIDEVAGERFGDDLEQQVFEPLPHAAYRGFDRALIALSRSIALKYWRQS